jgi:ribulose-phosphate 3-epimerase
LRRLRDLRAAGERYGQTFDIEVDGGISARNARNVTEAGATILVAGTAIFGHDASVIMAVRELREAARRNAP